MKLGWKKKGHRQIIGAALAAWYASGTPVQVRRKNWHREERTFVEVASAL